MALKYLNYKLFENIEWYWLRLEWFFIRFAMQKLEKKLKDWLDILRIQDILTHRL